MPISYTYPGVYIEEIPSGVHSIPGVSTSITAFVGYTVRGAVNEAVHISSFTEFENAFGGLAVDSPLSYCVRHFFENGGQEAYVVRVALGGSSGTAPGASDLTGDEAAKTGIYALEKVDRFNLLVMPDATVGAGMLGVLTEAIAYCARRRAFMIVDVPDAVQTVAQAQTWIGTTASPLRSRDAALYFPRLREPDPLKNNAVGSFPAAGAAAGLYARTDAQRGVWKAPAGAAATVVGATGLACALTDLDNDTLNPLALNCLRTFPVLGTVIWGARTARGADALADEYKYIPVRRLALFLEESLYRGTQWAVFEPNAEPLWAQIRLSVGAFLHGLFAQGAFQGRTPRDAYFVKCDTETTTQSDIDQGRMNIVVGFAPLKPAEFVIVTVQQLAGAIRPVRRPPVSLPPSSEQLLAMMSGHWVTASLYTIGVLGIPDLLAAGPRSAEELAETTCTKPDPLRRLMRALAARGVFAEREDGRFEQTELSDLLRADAAGSLRPLLLFRGGAVQWAPWGEMLHSIRTGETAFSKVHGAELFEYMKRDAAEAVIFNRAMTQSSVLLAAEIVSACDFSRFGTIVDVGCGQGWLLSAILAAAPAARGILFDMPHVVKTAQAVAIEQGVADRCQLVGGSFFESVPAGGEAYIMKWIIHDWDDDDAAKILRNVRAVIPRDGRLIVFDRVLPERIAAGDPVTQVGTLMDLNMLVNVTGRERTEAQFRTLFAAAGFQLTSARSTSSSVGIVEGVPA